MLVIIGFLIWRYPYLDLNWVLFLAVSYRTHLYEYKYYVGLAWQGDLFYSVIMQALINVRMVRKLLLAKGMCVSIYIYIKF